jgi:CRISPR-associated protein Cmr2
MTIDWELKTAAFLDAIASAAGTEQFEPIRADLLAAAGMKMNSEMAERLADLRFQTAGFDRPPWLRDDEYEVCANDPHVQHPLSGAKKEIKADNIALLLQTSVREGVAAVTGKAATGKAREKLFRLWRQLPETLRHTRPDIPWNILPADPRIPTHSLWEHAAVMSCFAGAGEQPALLLFTIASVQEFVTAARRTQDSWMASFLHSWLAWAAMQPIVSQLGPDAVISPCLRYQPLVDWWMRNNSEIQLSDLADPDEQSRLIASMPNIFSAIVPASQVENLAGLAENKVRSSWNEISSAVKEKMEGSLTGLKNNKAWDTIWQRQTDSFPDQLGLFWSSCQWPAQSPASFMAEINRQPELGTETRAGHLQAIIEQLPEAQQGNGLLFHLLSEGAGAALLSRKSLRDFSQTEEPGFKCSLCGRRQTLCDHEQAGYRELNSFWQKLAQTNARTSSQDSKGLKLEGRLKRGEKLCAVCLVKRLALESFFTKNYLGDHHLFPSTASLAVTPFLIHCLKNEVTRQPLLSFVGLANAFLSRHGILYPATLPAAARQQLAKTITNGCLHKPVRQLDGAWYYPNSWNRDSLKQEYGLNTDALKGEITDCVNGLHNLLTAAKKAGIRPPSRYYAIVAMDGDRMGDWLTGKKARPLVSMFHPAAEQSRQNARDAGADISFLRPMGAAMQMALSSCLADFSLQLANPTVTGYGGTLVYAGGDDLLALYPVADLDREHSLLTALLSIQKIFTGNESGFIEHGSDILRGLGGKKGMTVSAGVAIIHHSWPLNRAIALAGELLREAKENWARNSFVTGFLSRSGGERRAGGKFASDPEDTSLLTTLAAISKYMADSELSPRIGYRLGNCRWARGSDTYPWPGGLTRALEQELMRLCSQHIQVQDRGRAKTIMEEVISLFKQVQAHILEAGDPVSLNLWENMTNLLIIAAFLNGREV